MTSDDEIWASFCNVVEPKSSFSLLALSATSDQSSNNASENGVVLLNLDTNKYFKTGGSSSALSSHNSMIDGQEKNPVIQQSEIDMDNAITTLQLSPCAEIKQSSLTKAQHTDYGPYDEEFSYLLDKPFEDSDEEYIPPENELLLSSSSEELKLPTPTSSCPTENISEHIFQSRHSATSFSLSIQAVSSPSIGSISSVSTVDSDSPSRNVPPPLSSVDVGAAIDLNYESWVSLKDL